MPRKRAMLSLESTDGMMSIPKPAVTCICSTTRFQLYCKPVEASLRSVRACGVRKFVDAWLATVLHSQSRFGVRAHVATKRPSLFSVALSLETINSRHAFKI